MNISQNGINLIKNFEGVRLTAYKCPAGKWTIGYGHTTDVKQGMTITQAQAEGFLKQDLKIYENYVKLLNLNLNQNQFDALVSFTYNCGAGNLKTLTNNRTLAQIADALLLYNKSSNGQVLTGLTRRRQAERELFLKTSNNLPYDVTTTANLNIREGAGIQYKVIKTVPKGTKLTVWAVQTLGTEKWGKNQDGYFSLAFTK